MAPDVQLRKFHADDASFISALGQQAFAEFSDTSARSTLWLAEHHPCFVATLGTVQLGFAIIDLRPEVGDPCLVAIAVKRGHRGRGIGRKLLQAVEQLARARGIQRIKTHTADANLAALDLFLKCGYRIEKCHPRYYRQSLNAYELSKTL